MIYPRIQIDIAVMSNTGQVGKLHDPNNYALSADTDYVDISRLQNEFFRTVMVMALVACLIADAAIWAQLTIHPMAPVLFAFSAASCVVCGYLAVRKLQNLQRLAWARASRAER